MGRRSRQGPRRQGGYGERDGPPSGRAQGRAVDREAGRRRGGREQAAGRERRDGLPSPGGPIALLRLCGRSSCAALALAPRPRRVATLGAATAP